MIKRLILLLLLLNALNQRCLEGCLRCSEDNRCKFCNILKGYSLEYGRCIKKQVPNCLEVNEKNRCKICEEKYYLDTVSLRCVELPLSTNVDNCLYHLGPGNCKQCVTGFSLKKGGCIEIGSPIPDCEIENSRAECKRCNSGFILSIDQKNCIAQPELENCASFSNIQCNECSSGYLKNENYYLNFIFGFKNTKQYQLLTEYLQNSNNSVVDGHKFKTCQKTEVENCLIFQTFDRCKKCTEGYFVNRKYKCEMVPEPTIKNCRKYSSLISCLDCAQGYYLKSSEECTPIFPIENCFLYKTDSNTSTCTRCNEEYYLSAENLCTLRSVISKIDFCETLAFDFEKCTKCNNGYIPTSDGLRCLPFIEHCLKYDYSNRISFNLNCDTCEDGFYYNENDKVCIKGTLDNCEIYHKTKNECVLCEPLYFLVGSICRSHERIESCESYSETEQNICNQCNQHHFLFTAEHLCVKVDRIKNCKNYLTKTTCGECEKGFYLTNPSVCQLIPPEENCVEKEYILNEFLCTECRDGFVLSNNRCFQPYQYFTRGCEESNVDGKINFDDLKCEYCSKNFTPINFKNSFYCMERNLVKHAIGYDNLNLDPDCLQFRKNEDTNQMDCLKCKKDMVLVVDKCMPNCTDLENQTIYRQFATLHNLDGNDDQESVQIENSNLCRKTIPNCKYASLIMEQSFVNPEYACEECVSEYLSIITLGENSKSVVKFNPRNKKHDIHMPSNYAPALQCRHLNDFESFVGDVKVKDEKKYIENCEYYYSVDRKTLGCFKCKHGMTGKVISKVKNCELFANAEDCSKCEQGYYLHSVAECKAVKPINHCTLYDQTTETTICSACEDDYFVNEGDNVCDKRVISYRKAQSTKALNADTYECITGYTKINDICQRLPEMCKTAIDNSGIIECTVCDEKVGYLVGIECKLGTILKCEEFSVDANTCAKCEYNHYIENGKCVENVNSPLMNDPALCKDFSQTIPFECETCHKGAELFNITNKCVPKVNNISNCDKWEDEYRCKDCDEGYYLNNLSKRCMAIPSDDKCLIYKTNQILDDEKFNADDQVQNGKNKYSHTCTKCRKTFYLTDGECVDYLELMRQNCEISNVTGSEDFGPGNGCIGCTTANYPMDFTNKYICLNRKYLSKKVSNFTASANCERYSFDGTIYHCEQCIYPTFLDGNDCVTQCSDITHIKLILQFENNFTVRRNVCSTVPIGFTITPGCEEYIESYQDLIWANVDSPGPEIIEFDLACAKCSDEYIPVFLQGLRNQSTTFIDINKGTDSYDFVNERYSLPFSCVDNTSPNDLIIGLKNNDNFIEHCELYTLLDLDPTATSIYGCFKCKWGYTGRVNKSEDPNTPGTYHGYIEYCEPVVGCNTNAKYGGLNHHKEFIKINGSINNYFTCHECTDPTHILTGFFNWLEITIPGVPDILGVFPFRFDSSKDVNNNDSETGINLEDYSHTLKCVDPGVFANIDTNDPGINYKVFNGSNEDIANCALRIVSTKNKGTFVNGGSYNCLACLPGFIPRYDSIDNLFITVCEIASLGDNNCDGNRPLQNKFNSCTDCIFLYDPNLRIVNFDSCFINTDPLVNCLSGYLNEEIVGSEFDVCVICNPGFELVNNTCLEIITPGCSKTNYTKNKFEVSNFKREFLTRNYYLYLQLGIEGCLDCSSAGDVLVKNEKDDNIDKFICATPYLNQFIPIPNCEIIGWDNEKIICKKCTTLYILIGDDECLDQTNFTNNLPFCSKAENKNGSICEECVSDLYLNIGGWCTLINMGLSTLITYCENYEINASKNATHAICSKCESDYYVVIENGLTYCNPIDSPNCSEFDPAEGCTKCQRGYGLILKKMGVVERKVCIEFNNENTGQIFDHDNYCLELDIVDLQGFNLTCKKCDNYSVLRKIIDVASQKNWCYSIINETPNCSEYHIAITGAPALSTSELHCISCVSENDSYFFNLNDRTCPTRTQISYCKTFEEKINRCLECEFGYKLDSNAENCLNVASLVGNGYIETCRKMETCDENIQYDGLSAEMTSIFSCHKCTNPNEIPIAALEFDFDSTREGFFQIKNLARYSYETGSNFSDVDGNESVVQCMEINENNTGISTGSFAFPVNCGLALTKVNYPKYNYDSVSDQILDFTTISVTCAACRPKYAPSFTVHSGSNSFINYIVHECTLITNCEFSRWFNSCTQCDPEYSFGYTKEKGINFSTCVLYPENRNCLSVETILSNKKCRFCKKGTYMNKDGICEIIKPTRCKFQEFKFSTFYKEQDLNIGLSDYTKNVGCSQCEEGFVAILAKEDKFICTHSLYHSENSLISNTFYKKNCENYSITDKGHLICKKCAEDFVVSQDGNCLAKANLINCKIACDQDLCGICREGTVLVNRQCLDPEIDNCEKYGNNYLFNDKNCNMAGLEYQVCIKCEDEYYLNSGVCSKGEVSNCKNMETKYICNECQEDFTLVTMKEGKSYCYPIDKKYNCKKFDAQKFQSSVLNCEECVEENYIKSESRTDFYEKSCMSFRFIENCIKYDNNPIAIADSSFICLECNENTFLQNGNCLERMSKPAECSEFDKLADRCLRCHVGYFISPDGIMCTPYPQGLNGCRIYRTKTTCKACESGKYLREGICLDVMKPIENCVFYDDETICIECEPGFLNIKGNCVQAVAKDCLTYEGINACRTCRPDAGLKMELGIVDCVQQNIPQCTRFENKEPYKCVICGVDFYPDSDGVCMPVSTAIEKCMIYSDTDTCEKCNKGSALSQDKKNCLFTPDIISNLDSNCQDSNIPLLPICNTCKPGFRFSFGKCVSCNEELINSGCANCDPDFPDVCLMCGNGWIQTPEGTCIQPITESSGIVGI